MTQQNRHKIAGIAAFFLVAVWLIAIDRSSKAWAADALQQGVVGIDLGPVALTLVHNWGAAFGMGQGSGLFFVGVAAAIVIAILIWLFLTKEYSALELVGMALVFAGGIGNAIDRLTTGYVTDFIEFTFIDFPVFNVADICVTCGVIIVIAAMISRFRQADLEVRAEKVAAEAQAKFEAGQAAGSAPAKDAARAEKTEPAEPAEPEEPLSPEDAEWEADVAAYEAEYENGDASEDDAGPSRGAARAD